MIHVEAPAQTISAIGPDPVPDGIVSIRPPWLRGDDITLRVPEIIYSRAMKDTYYIDHMAGGFFEKIREHYVHVPPAWETVEEGKQLRYTVSVPGKCTFRAGVDAGEDVVRLTWAFRNETGRVIPDLMVQFCPCFDRTETFRDPEGERAWILREGRFFTSRERNPQQGVPLMYPAEKDPADDVICLESVCGNYVAGIGWDVRPQHFLHNSALSCIHTEPACRSLAPGEEQQFHGALYLLEGRKEDAVRRYRDDWR